MEGLLAWFRSLSAREQLLLKVALFIVIVGGGLSVAYQAASAYRQTAATDLASAVQMRDDIARLQPAGSETTAVSLPNNDGSVRGIVVAAASQFGLVPSAIEPDGPTGIRATFEPVNAQNVYQWLDLVERSGLIVNRLSLVRGGEGDVVQTVATIVSR